MKYYELMRIANNVVGADFAYCSEEELKRLKEEFQPTYPVVEISKEQYEEEIARQHKQFLRLVTGYPKY